MYNRAIKRAAMSLLCFVAILSCIFIGTASAAPAKKKSSKGPVVIGYYPSWSAGQFTPSEIPFKRLTHVHFAFAIPQGPGSDEWKFESSDDSFKQLVTFAHAAGTKVLLSYGGWGGSQTFSGIVSSAARRTKFVKNALGFVKKFNLDGIDIDWEYPGSAGNTNDFNAAHDTDNFLLLLKQLRKALDARYKGSKRKEITAATSMDPWSKNGTPLKDLRAFVPLLDRVGIMTYDVYGSWSSTTGPNSPLNTSPENSLAITSAVKAWKRAGFPAKKIIVGVAFYGRGATASKAMSNSQYVPFNAGSSKEYTYKDLRSQGILATSTKAVAPWVRHFDKVSSTPWLYNKNTKAFISYDDPVSLKLKGQFVKRNGYAGVMIWEVSQDTASSELLVALRKGLRG
ncbi:glycoside hydrolase [Jimgerdemannia flammicorona]|uniref:Glycoside hydrolase n=1 Tax=Jimgerdemannia flammicorona TaxID=994334 RepID=A0A433QTP7_9FUNG|nr:glycoside hydrolase [Jimgerdemannia flammicorona]